MNKLYLALLTAVLLLAGATWAEEGALVVAHTPDYQPLNYMREGELVGIEADNAMELAKHLGLKLERRVMPFADLLQALNAGDVDIIMAGVSVTDERKARMLFTDPFMQVGQMAIILADNAASFGHPRTMYRPGIRIGVEPNTTGHRYVENRLPDSNMQFYANPETAFEALRQNQVDLFIHDAPTSWRLASDRDNLDMLGLFRPLTTEQLAWAVHKDNALLAARVNAALAQLQSTGTIRAIQNFWIPVKVNVR